MFNSKCKARLSQIGLSLGENGAVQQCRKKNQFNSAENENFSQQCRKYEQVSR